MEIVSARKAFCGRELTLFFLIMFVGVYLSGHYLPLSGEEAKTVVAGGLAVDSVPLDSGEEKWFEIKSEHFMIYCAHNVDLKTIANKLASRGLFISGVYKPNPVSAPSGKISYRMDMLLRRAENILDMHPRMPKITVKIFKDREELSGEYLKIFKERSYLKSFYVHKYNTIYTSEANISDSVIAHEMGHAVVDHYFSIIPPPKVAEILAQYVDMHLED